MELNKYTKANIPTLEKEIARLQKLVDKSDAIKEANKQIREDNENRLKEYRDNRLDVIAKHFESKPVDVSYHATYEEYYSYGHHTNYDVIQVYAKATDSKDEDEFKMRFDFDLRLKTMLVHADIKSQNKDLYYLHAAVTMQKAVNQAMDFDWTLLDKIKYEPQKEKDYESTWEMQKEIWRLEEEVRRIKATADLQPGTHIKYVGDRKTIYLTVSSVSDAYVNGKDRYGVRHNKPLDFSKIFIED
jgi:hypothetical protein